MKTDPRREALLGCFASLCNAKRIDRSSFQLEEKLLTKMFQDPFHCVMCDDSPGLKSWWVPPIPLPLPSLKPTFMVTFWVGQAEAPLFCISKVTRAFMASLELSDSVAL